METVNWIVRPSTEGVTLDVARHVMSRLGTAMRLECDKYNGARAVDGSVVFGGAHAGHLVTLVAGPDADSGDLAVRLIVSGNLGAKVAAVVGPVVSLAVIALAFVSGAGPAGLVAGLIVGGALGFGAAYGAFVAASRLEARRGASAGAATVAGSLSRSLFLGLDTLGVECVRGGARFGGLDAGALRRPAGDPWCGLATDVVAALAG